MSLFARTKNWGSEILTDTDLEDQLDLIINNMKPTMIEDYSANDTEAQNETDPYPSSVLSKATSLAEELERLRYQITQITGESNWYIDPAASIKTHASRHNVGGSDAIARRFKTGTYTGDATEHRNIAHGLGVSPVHYIIFDDSGRVFYSLPGTDAGTIVCYFSLPVITTTTGFPLWNDTNFVVGKPSSYIDTANFLNATYRWVAFI